MGCITRHYYRVTLSSKLHSFNFAGMSTKSPSGNALLHIPKENRAITSHTSEACVVRRNGYVDDGITVGFVLFDWRIGLYSCRRILGILWDSS